MEQAFKQPIKRLGAQVMVPEWSNFEGPFKLIEGKGIFHDLIHPKIKTEATIIFYTLRAFRHY